MKLFVLAAIAIAVVLLTGAAWRFVTLRNKGTQVLMRTMPADGVHGWRHGILTYDQDCIRFFKLRSFSFGPDIVLARNQLTFEGKRDLSPDERAIMPETGAILELSCAAPTAADNRGGADDRLRFEFGADHHAAMALVSWIESSPDHRQVRTDMNVLHQRALRSPR
ncbi:DUF2550 domain-containing protein [Corynebacterium aquatimens]|uniref:DUF2550 domain-containing protein n=1 Tax=Corynebacterium aquatimens TaxID=1190508 RepID=A0A931GT07_9CORY|nr:DUF2550 domain-containing protein [Corynebacterium aquatimens]MBG6121380.1 hypothetical protein [Corynebacterium aquatimens]WJY66076.1 hypothetical protein CAQUA_06875 [Corynebacterium aquatimens]